MKAQDFLSLLLGKFDLVSTLTVTKGLILPPKVIM